MTVAYMTSQWISVFRMEHYLISKAHSSRFPYFSGQAGEIW